MVGRKTAVAGTALGFALLVATGARAQPSDEEGFGATGNAERPVPSGAGDDPTAAATVVEVDERPHADGGIEDLVLEIPGTQAWATGALGAFSALSIRGTGTDQTVVLVGDLPLTPSSAGTVDLSTLPAGLLERIEVYRGGAPVWLGAGAVGGVLRLVPRAESGTGAEGSGTVGSHGLLAGSATTAVADRPGTTTWTASVGAAHADNDYPFVRDPTPLAPGDEREVRRRNARTEEGHGLVHLRTPSAGGELQAFVLGYGRTGGVPGHAIQPALHTRRQLARVVSQAGWTRRGDAGGRARAPWRVQAAVGASYERDALTDRFGEIGFGRGRVTDDRTLGVGGRVAGELAVEEWLGLTTVVTLAHDRRAPHDAMATAQVPTSHRTASAVAAEVRLSGDVAGARFEVRPSARLEVTRSELAEIALGREGQEANATTAAPTFRLAGVIEPVSGLAVNASVASATRTPTMLELFGDRAFLLGDTRLAPERSLSAEVGAVAKRTDGVLTTRAEARLFALWVDDLVAYQRNGQNQAVPRNVDRARILGAELGTRLEAGRHVTLVGAATWLDPRDLGRDRVLPLRPRFQGYGRPEVHLGPWGALERVTVYGDVTWVGANFADRTNLVVVDGRLTLGAGVVLALLAGRLEVALSGSDLTDERPSDLLGFPLPGRTFTLTVTGRTEAAR